MMRGIPGQRCRLDVAGAPAEIIARIARRPVRGAGVGQVPRGMVCRNSPIFAKRDLMLGLPAVGTPALGDRVRPWLPQTCVPLADKATPVFDSEFLRVLTDMEDGLLVAIIRCGDQVYLVEVALWE